MTHSPEHDELLERVVTGELAADAGEVRELLERCGACRAELAELLAVTGRLETTGRGVRADLATAREAHAQADTTEAAAILEREWARARGARRRRLALVLVAAAAAVLALVWLRPQDAPAVPPDEVLLGDELRLLAPVGAVERFGAFRWEARVGTGGWYELYVYDGTDAGSGAELARSPRLFETRWDPDPATTDAWPDDISWTVEAYAPSGDELATGRARASRRP